MRERKQNAMNNNHDYSQQPTVLRATYGKIIMFIRFAGGLENVGMCTTC
jgi:hypothetical protein